MSPVQLCRLRPAARHLPQVRRCGPRHWYSSAHPRSCPCPCARSGSLPHCSSQARRFKYLQVKALRRYPSLFHFSPTHFWCSPCSVGRGGAFALRRTPRMASTLRLQHQSSTMPSNPSVKPTRSGLRPPRAAYLKRSLRCFATHSENEKLHLTPLRSAGELLVRRPKARGKGGDVYRYHSWQMSSESDRRGKRPSPFRTESLPCLPLW